MSLPQLPPNTANFPQTLYGHDRHPRSLRLERLLPGLSNTLQMLAKGRYLPSSMHVGIASAVRL